MKLCDNCAEEVLMDTKECLCGNTVFQIDKPKKYKASKINIVDAILKFNHTVTDDKIILYKIKDDGRNLLKQLEDEINKQI